MCVKCGDMYHVGKGGSEATGSLGSAFGGAAALPTYTIQKAADYLINGFWEQRGFSGAKFNVKAGGTLTYSVAGLDPEGAWFARKALEAWSIVSGIKFVSGAASSADIVFRQDNPDGNGAYAWSEINGSGHITRSYVNVSTDWYRGDEGEIDSYSYQTYVHEIGHALGLGHAGNYNGSANFGRDAHYANESWQMSVMSYFSQTENPNVNASFAFLLGPMAADIYAIQKMYGKSTTSNVGDTTWGYNSNAQGSYSDFTSLAGGSATVAMTVFDSGGEDTFDFSRSGRNQKIDLTQGKFSDVLGYKGNVGIALGTRIENAKGGSGNDSIYGNALSNKLYGNDGNDRLYGGAGNDKLVGGNGRDRLDGGTGFDFADYSSETTSLSVYLETGRGWGAAYGDTLYRIEGLVGGSGNDKLFGNKYNNHLSGKDGHDLLDGMGGHDRLYGGTGDDQLRGDSGNDRLSGDDGADRIWGGAGNDFLFGNTGVDKLWGGSGNDRLYGGGGNDELRGEAGDDRVSGEGGADLIWGGAGNDFLFGNAGDDQLWGGLGDDRLYGGGANDELRGETGNDRLSGDDGDDRILGGAGDDFLFGNTGADKLWGGSGNDRLYGGGANDELWGDSGNDRLSGEGGADLIWGGSGNDYLFGNAGDDKLWGGLDNDRLYGGGANDELWGDSGNDHLSGEDGSDRLWGGAGDDFLFGGTGADVLTGGSGRDKFYFSNGVDRITDFSAAEQDKIFIKQVHIPTGVSVAQMLRDQAEVVNGDVHIDLRNGNKLIIEDVSDKMSLADDIQFY